MRTLAGMPPRFALLDHPHWRRADGVSRERTRGTVADAESAHGTNDDDAALLLPRQAGWDSPEQAQQWRASRIGCARIADDWRPGDSTRIHAPASTRRSCPVGRSLATKALAARRSSACIGSRDCHRRERPDGDRPEWRPCRAATRVQGDAARRRPPKPAAHHVPAHRSTTRAQHDEEGDCTPVAKRDLLARPRGIAVVGGQTLVVDGIRRAQASVDAEG